MCFVHGEYCGSRDQYCGSRDQLHDEIFISRHHIPFTVEISFIFFINNFLQAAMWRIKKSNVSKLDQSVIEVSIQGKGARVWLLSAWSLCVPNDYI